MAVLDGSNRGDYTSIVVKYRRNVESMDNDLYNLPINNNDVYKISEHLESIIKILDSYINK